MVASDGTGSANLFGWAILFSIAYIVLAAAIMIQSPDTAKDIDFLGDNTIVLIGVLFIAFLFIIAMQLAPEAQEEEIVHQAAKPAFSEAPAPPPPKEFKPVEPAPAPPEPPAPPAGTKVVEAAVVPQPPAEPVVVSYPTKAEGGRLYGDTMVKIDNNTTLQVRSVLADQSELY